MTARRVINPEVDRAVSETAALIAIGAVFLCAVAANTFVDPDMWHLMALTREALAQSQFPLEDPFAYTPTVSPVVHHEWGTGAILHLVSMHTGATGILVLKYLLSAAISVGAVRCAHRGKAGWPVLCTLVPLAMFMSLGGFTTIRAQMFTLLALVYLLSAVAEDRQGNRRWIGLWLVVYLLWLNLHAGFAIGVVLLCLHALEQACRRQAVRHLLFVLGAMVALIAINPYGLKYYVYLWPALIMDRPLITEWQPLWTAWPPLIGFYVVSLVVVAYCIWQTGWRALPGLILVAATAYAALRHQRHLSIYAVTWMCIVPGFVQQTGLGELIDEMWSRFAKLITVGSSVVAVAAVTSLVIQQPWRLLLPANPGDHPVLMFPVGAVQFLDQVNFRGNVMTPFNVGAFVSWKLHPHVKVSLDGRYEVAYPRGALREHVDFYNAAPGWQETLDKYPTDAVLTERSSRVTGQLLQIDGWARVYQDDVYVIYARQPTSLLPVDRSGQRLSGSFP